MDINDNSVMEDIDVEDQRTIMSEEFDPKKREGVVNLKNDKVFTYIQVESELHKSLILRLSYSFTSARVND